MPIGNYLVETKHALSLRFGIKVETPNLGVSTWCFYLLRIIQKRS